MIDKIDIGEDDNYLKFNKIPTNFITIFMSNLILRNDIIKP